MSIAVHTDVPLKNYTTMRLGGNARFMADIFSVEDANEVIKRAQDQTLKIFFLGGGSNTLVHDDGFDGIILRNRISGFEIIDETPSDITIKIGGGENWDEIVKRTVDLHLSGIECLSAIPGSAGAAPVQNIGAYGQEIADVLVSVEAYDTTTHSLVTLTNADCQFGYRSSIFRDSAIGRYFITSITLKLFKSPPSPPFYNALQDYLDKNETTIYTPRVIRDAIIDIRSVKLPDPKKQPNTGSFFKNAIVEEWQLASIKDEYIDIPFYDMPNGLFKIPSGWLIEQAGLKGKLLHGMRVHDKNALVLINESATSFSDLASARDEIISAVRDKFRIQIEQEPLEMSI